MNAKLILKPTRLKILTFSMIFAVIYFIPYFEVEGCQTCILQAGHYPLIAGFLAQLIFIPDLFTGGFIFSEFIGFTTYLISFIMVYVISCFVGTGLRSYFDRKNNKEISNIYDKKNN